MTQWRARAGDDRGAIAVLAAFAMTVFLFAAALAIDIGGRVEETRREQAVADLAALDAARDLSSDAGTQDLAWRSALRNGIDHTVAGNSVTAVRGVVSNGVFTATGVNPTAVQVTVGTAYSDFFGGGVANLQRSAVAVTGSGEAQFWIGSTLVDINAGLGRFGGTLTLVGYNGLATGNVTLGALKTALGFSAATPDQFLASTASVAQLVNASATLLNAGNPTASAALTTLGTQIAGTFNSTNTITVGQAVGIATGQGAAFASSVNLLQMVTGGIQVANQKAGLSVSLAVSLPGLAGASVSFSGITPPTISPYGPVGITATNNQVTATLTVSVNVSVAGLSISSVQLPLSLILGGATGILSAIDCTGVTPNDIKLATDFKDVNATISNGVVYGPVVLGVPTVLGSVAGTVTVPSADTSGTVVNDPANFVPNQAPVTVSSNFGSATASLTTNLTLTPLLDTTTSAAIAAVLDPILPSLLSTISSGLQSSYGIHIGNASYLGIQAACNVVRLAQ